MRDQGGSRGEFEGTTAGATRLHGLLLDPSHLPSRPLYSQAIICNSGLLGHRLGLRTQADAYDVGSVLRAWAQARLGSVLRV